MYVPGVPKLETRPQLTLLLPAGSFEMIHQDLMFFGFPQFLCVREVSCVRPSAGVFIEVKHL